MLAVKNLCFIFPYRVTIQNEMKYGLIAMNRASDKNICNVQYPSILISVPVISVSVQLGKQSAIYSHLEDLNSN